MTFAVVGVVATTASALALSYAPISLRAAVKRTTTTVLSSADAEESFTKELRELLAGVELDREALIKLAMAEIDEHFAGPQEAGTDEQSTGTDEQSAKSAWLSRLDTPAWGSKAGAGAAAEPLTDEQAAKQKWLERIDEGRWQMPKSAAGSGMAPAPPPPPPPVPSFFDDEVGGGGDSTAAKKAWLERLDQPSWKKAPPPAPPPPPPPPPPSPPPWKVLPMPPRLPPPPPAAVDANEKLTDARLLPEDATTSKPATESTKKAENDVIRRHIRSLKEVAAAKEKAKKTAEEKAIARGRERDAKRKERDRKWGVERMVDGLRTGWWWK